MLEELEDMMKVVRKAKGLVPKDKSKKDEEKDDKEKKEHRDDEDKDTVSQEQEDKEKKNKDKGPAAQIKNQVTKQVKKQVKKEAKKSLKEWIKKLCCNDEVEEIEELGQVAQSGSSGTGNLANPLLESHVVDFGEVGTISAPAAASTSMVPYVIATIVGLVTAAAVGTYLYFHYLNNNNDASSPQASPLPDQSPYPTNQSTFAPNQSLISLQSESFYWLAKTATQTAADKGRHFFAEQNVNLTLLAAYLFNSTGMMDAILNLLSLGNKSASSVCLPEVLQLSNKIDEAMDKGGKELIKGSTPVSCTLQWWYGRPDGFSCENVPLYFNLDNYTRDVQCSPSYGVLFPGSVKLALSGLARNVTYTLLGLPEVRDYPVGNCTFYLEYLARNATAMKLLQGVVCNKTTALDLYNKNISYTEVEALAPALQQLTKLDWLNLGANILSPQGATALAPALQNMTKLNYLYLGANILGPQDATTLGDTLQPLRLLTDVYLNNNAIGLVGCTNFTNEIHINNPNATVHCD